MPPHPSAAQIGLIVTFAALVAGCIVAAHWTAARPASRRGWRTIAITIAFLTWLMPLMGALVSR